MRLVYFAWVREKTGMPDEVVSLPSGVSTVADLINWQLSRGENYISAFGDLSVIRVALNQEYVTFDATLANDDEVAFFPPVTGG